ncbi:tryptophan 2,3-dioxygenase family protein [Streptomyces californicus]|uniref:tryptophan 2,3-dioxygenase family protein n=1 Tax=Streptomyces californicus TaxID=67351 RepID=UPI00378A4384
MTDDVTYQDYLELDTLLSLQKPRSVGSSALRATVLSEQFFIVAHQASELWLRQAIADLEAVIDVFTTTDDASEAEWVVDLLHRSSDLLRVLEAQLVALDRLPVSDFAAFRKLLGTASGAQSEQFRRLAELIGLGKEDGPLYESFTAWVTRSGHTVAGLARSGPEAGVHYRIIEALLHLGNGCFRWQLGHVGVVTKIMGNQQGTGGTSGAEHLLGRCRLPFAELRELRAGAHTDLSVAAP